MQCKYEVVILIDIVLSKLYYNKRNHEMLVTFNGIGSFVLEYNKKLSVRFWSGLTIVTRNYRKLCLRNW